ncbi:MAG: hypothetical protein ACTSWX_06970 [Promethearchaeota archaeon]
MSSTVLASIISGLEGRVGSNPKILSIFPNTLDVSEELIIQKSLPLGATPNEIYEDTLGSNKILVYTFEIPNNENRNDLASIGFVVEQNVIIKNLQSVIAKLIKWLESNDLLNFEIIQENLPNILDGINNKSKIIINDIVFDLCCDVDLEEHPRLSPGIF